jgi:heme A synthase
MEFLKYAHSGLRWVALILLVVAIFNALSSKGKGKYEKKDKMLNLFAMIVLHIQLLIGLVLYFISPNVKFIEGWMKVKQLRFYGMEHLLIMVIAIAVVTIGRKKAENASNIAKKHGTIVKWFTIGLILILAGIPWPFRGFGTGWF